MKIIAILGLLAATGAAHAADGVLVTALPGRIAVTFDPALDVKYTVEISGPTTTSTGINKPASGVAYVFDRAPVQWRVVVSRPHTDDDPATNSLNPKAGGKSWIIDDRPITPQDPAELVIAAEYRAGFSARLSVALEARGFKDSQRASIIEAIREAADGEIVEAWTRQSAKLEAEAAKVKSRTVKQEAISNER
ncbi:MAG: hypothetical protein ABFD89_12125 [Bryobacteraceae bacterium]